MDAYRGIFVLCTINGLCAWNEAIAGPFNNKNLNAKLICDFGVCVLFLCSFCGAKGYSDEEKGWNSILLFSPHVKTLYQ